MRIQTYIVAMLMASAGGGCALQTEVQPEEGAEACDHELSPGEEPVSVALAAPPEVLGTYDTNFNSIALWTADSYSEVGVTYDDDFTYAIVEWDVANNRFIGENAFGFLRTVWHEDERGLMVCFDVLSAETFGEAKEAKLDADPSDIEDGCSGAMWTTLGRR